MDSNYSEAWIRPEPFPECQVPWVEIEEQIETGRGGELSQMEFV